MTLILPRCPEARGNTLILTLHRLESSFELSGHAARPSRITSAHHQTVFKPPFMTASAPPLPLMIVNSGTRWLPEPETFGSKSGRVCRPKAQTGHQPHSFDRRFIVCEPFGRVELSSINSVFLYVSVALPTQPKARTGTEQLCKRFFRTASPLVPFTICRRSDQVPTTPPGPFPCFRSLAHSLRAP